MSRTSTPPAAAPAPALDDDAPPPGADRFYEVVDGQVVENPPMGALETTIATLLVRLFYRCDEADQLGRMHTEALFLLDRGRPLKRRPDLAFVSFARWPKDRPVPRKESWGVVPELAVEVVSESNRAGHVMDKVRDYFAAGVRLVWVIYPAQRWVYAYRSATDVRILAPGDDLDGGDVIRGFRIAVADLFGNEAGPEPEPAPAPAPAGG